MFTTRGLVRDFIVLLLFALVSTGAALAQNKVVVIPLSGDDLQPLMNVVTVSKENGDFADPVEAMEAITDARESNPYLLIIGPGVYPLSQSLFMKEYVDISGSGRNATRLEASFERSANANESGIVVGANNASLRDLTIKNVDEGERWTWGIINNGVSPTISDVNISLADGGTLVGILSQQSGTSTIDGVRLNVSGGTSQAVGILAQASANIIVRDSLIDIAGHGSAQFSSYGIQNNTAGIVTISNTSILVSGTTVGDYGVYSASSTEFTKISNSKIAGATNSIRASTGSGPNETYISDSIVTGLVSGNPKCSFVFQSDGLALTEDCQQPP